MRKAQALLLIVCGLLLSFSSAFAYPAQVIIIRHGEKPADPNLTQLDPQGCVRAFSLPSFFQTNSVVNQFGPPAAIYSPQLGRDGGTFRPQETISPTAIALHLQIHAQFSEIEFSGVVNDIMNRKEYDGKTVILSWEHHNIPALAKEFGLSLPPEAQVWPGHVFDEAWVIKFSGPRQVSSFQIVPEHVLLTDNPKGDLSSWGKKQKFPESDPCYTDQQNLVDLCQNNDHLEMIRKTALQPL